MFVRICRYRVLPEMLDKHLAIQRRASDIYRRFLPEEPAYFQSKLDPCEWVEIHPFFDEAACRESTERINREPEIMRLWDEFQAMLDPESPPVIEEFTERRPSDGHA
ncbi:MAG: hypothetical protein AB7U73_18095 [Pirellulales bacterium]